MKRELGLSKKITLLLSFLFLNTYENKCDSAFSENKLCCNSIPKN
jgi:hypothetical protein